MSGRKRKITTSTIPKSWDETHGEAVILPVEQYHVVSWSPDEIPGRSPATQVHLWFDVPVLDKTGRLYVRFKSAEELDLFITILQMYRLEVWGKRERVE